ncbi:hypothetical protein MKX03_020444 [Papaver bracteatum]|nr:hypothetical protein MKX03_020444 [Papaver bracteatum]
MDSLQGKFPGFQSYRSPRIIDLQQRDAISGFHLSHQQQENNSLSPLWFDHKIMEREPVQ